MNPPGGGATFSRTSKQLYRDCLRLINHIAGKSTKAQKLTKIVGGEFRKNAMVKDENQVAALKANAIRGLSNYLMMEASAKDEKFQGVSAEFAAKEAQSIKDADFDEIEKR